MASMSNEKKFEHQSLIDPTRKTVGAMYCDAQKNNSEDFIEIGDFSHELMKSLVDDLNEAFISDPFDGSPFYVIVYEKKDLQMKNSILRRLYKTKYRPYPEDDTTVFWVDPETLATKFCWCLPHSTEMDNMIITSYQYDQSFIDDIKAWRKLDLKHFGFDKVRSKVIEGDTLVEKEVLVPSNENRDIPLNFSALQIPAEKNILNVS